MSKMMCTYVMQSYEKDLFVRKTIILKLPYYRIFLRIMCQNCHSRPPVSVNQNYPHTHIRPKDVNRDKLGRTSPPNMYSKLGIKFSDFRIKIV